MKLNLFGLMILMALSVGVARANAPSEAPLMARLTLLDERDGSLPDAPQAKEKGPRKPKPQPGPPKDDGDEG